MIRRRRRRRVADRGITLLELAIAVLVLALGSIAALQATDQARLSIGSAQDRILAGLVARNRAEELRLPLGASELPDRVELAGQSFVVSTDLEPTAGGLVQAVITARSAGGAGAQVVIYLPGGAQ